ncbi:MAG: DNA-binding protein [Synergistaceae bacterium]|jgi:hypothetical protein|nr:DNA-binding protein [Synergistaceae bacterium]
MQMQNTVTVSGLLHHVRTDKKSDRYFPFSIRQETPWNDGSTRRDFLLSRAFLPEIQSQVKALPEGTPLKVRGVLQTSLGSGEMYIHVEEIHKIS